MIDNRVLRKVLGATREELTGSWNKLLYAGLHVCSVIIIGVIQYREREMGDILKLYKILVGKMKRGIHFGCSSGIINAGHFLQYSFPASETLI